MKEGRMSTFREIFERDKEHLRALRSMGWKCLVVRECELKNLARVSRRISRLLA